MTPKTAWSCSKKPERDNLEVPFKRGRSRKEHEEKPDLVLLDLIMPKMNGYEFCCHLKDDPATNDIPIIIITASGAKDLERQCFKRGVKEIIHKPYDSSYLLEKIAFYLGE